MKLPPGRTVASEDVYVYSNQAATTQLYPVQEWGFAVAGAFNLSGKVGDNGQLWPRVSYLFIIIGLIICNCLCEVYYWTVSTLRAATVST